MPEFEKKIVLVGAYFVVCIFFNWPNSFIINTKTVH